MKIVMYVLFLVTLLFSNLTQANMPVPKSADPYFIGVKKIVVMVVVPLEIGDNIPVDKRYEQTYREKLNSHLVVLLKDKVGDGAEVTDVHYFNNNDVPDDVLIVRFYISKKVEKIKDDEVLLGAVTTSFYRNEPSGLTKKKAYSRFQHYSAPYLFQAGSIDHFTMALESYLQQQINGIAERIKTDKNYKINPSLL